MMMLIFSLVNFAVSFSPLTAENYTQLIHDQQGGKPLNCAEKESKFAGECQKMWFCGIMPK